LPVKLKIFPYSCLLSADFKPGFLAVFTAISQLKNTQVGLSGSQEMHILSVEKWAYHGSTIYRDHEGLGILAQNYHPKTSLIFTF